MDTDQLTRLEVALHSETIARTHEVAQLKTAIGQLAADMQALLKTSLDEINTAASKIEHGIHELSGRVNDLSGRVSVVETHVANLQQTGGGRERRIAEVELQVNALNMSIFGDPARPDYVSLYAMIKSLPAELDKRQLEWRTQQGDALIALTERVTPIESWYKNRRALELFALKRLGGAAALVGGFTRRHIIKVMLGAGIVAALIEAIQIGK